MSKTTKPVSQTRARRNESVRVKEERLVNPRSISLRLLHFVDDNKYLILPADSIREIVDGQAVILIGRKRKIGRIEAQGESKYFLSTMLFIFSV